jgi:glycosyltransferase involved in cell wall biosynthesis
MVAEALGALGAVDVCILNRWRSPELELDWPPWVGDAEWCRVEASPPFGVRAMLRSVSPVSDRVAPDALSAARARFFSRRYDLTWCVEPRGYEPVAELVARPVVLDLHNVLSASLAHKRRLLVRRPHLAAAWREAIADPVYRPGIERRWRAWEARAVRACDRVVVCSEVDQSRLRGAPSVVPNCYRRPTRPAGRDRDPGGPLRIGFVGFLDYQPNFDAVRWFADAILPRVRRLERDAEFHVIGEAGPGLRDIGHRRGVRLLGFVTDLAPELAQLSVLVAPIRFGGGTRFKILEAFAHEIPVVSTTVGAEGIDGRDGEHLLLRDDPAAFARAVVDVHRDPVLRSRLVAAAARLYESRYTWERGVASVERVVADLTASTDDGWGRVATLETQ